MGPTCEPCTSGSPELGWDSTCTDVSPEYGRAGTCTDISPEALALIACRSGRSPICSLDVYMENGFDEAMGLDMTLFDRDTHGADNEVRRAHFSREHHGADNEVRRTNMKQTYRHQTDWRQEMAQHYRHSHLSGNIGEHELSDL